MLTVETQVHRKDNDTPVFPGMTGPVVKGELKAMAILEQGTQQGTTAVVLRIELEDGRTAIVQTAASVHVSLATTIGRALERFGERPAKP